MGYKVRAQLRQYHKSNLLDSQQLGKRFTSSQSIADQQSNAVENQGKVEVVLNLFVISNDLTAEQYIIIIE